MAQPTSSTTETTVSVHALSCGHFTLPEHQFVKPSSLSARKTVPSLAFLIQHQNSHSGKLTRILFDLGLRREVSKYPAPIQKHIETRQPMSTSPDVVESLAKGGLTPDDIDYIVYSHIHWDHIGTPTDFPHSTFIIGPNTLTLFTTPTTHHGTHSFFEPALLPPKRTIPLPPPPTRSTPTVPPTPLSPQGTLNAKNPWHPHPTLPLPHTLDLFTDTSLHIVHAPGHLPGHINLLARVAPAKYMYLGGDTCHDRRLLTGEKEIGEWVDGEGRSGCIHVDRGEAGEMIGRVRGVQEMGVEVVFAHDWEWEEGNRGRFWGS